MDRNDPRGSSACSSWCRGAPRRVRRSDPGSQVPAHRGRNEIDRAQVIRTLRFVSGPSLSLSVASRVTALVAREWLLGTDERQDQPQSRRTSTRSGGLWLRVGSRTVVAYSGRENERLVVECKSYLDCAGVAYPPRDIVVSCYQPFRHRPFFSLSPRGRSSASRNMSLATTDATPLS
jgi:hypothetical protein